MTGDEFESIGDRIRRYRAEKGLSLSQLESESRVSKGYLWSLENESGKRPSAETLFAVSEALGVTIGALLNRQILPKPPTDVPNSLREFAEQKDLPDTDVQMLAGIEFRGVRPQTRERWEHIYNAIRLSRMLDE